MMNKTNKVKQWSILISVLGMMWVQAVEWTYMKIAGIAGSAQHPTRNESGWIRVDSFHFKFSKGATADATVDLLKVGKGLDKASPLLFLTLCEGAEIPNIEVSVVRRPEGATSGFEVMVYELVGTRLTSLGGVNGTVPTADSKIALGEEIDFSVRAIKVTYVEFESTTGVEIARTTRGWDFANNKPF